ncbi:ATP-binding protein [Bifidobacterium felsineum]|uniref:ATP-binding protein n=1 Tax=Bifidobacterium felsineum TaxID=2045440 RepID=UPI001BDC8368|nr:ATP-binding protein [Bifidobacterium felsineum]MBT1164461.1 ATP-binding protein [Bifidobacterium felsineum]
MVKALYPRPGYQALLERYRDVDQIKVLRGVRRCGKSAILTMYMRHLIADGVRPENIFYKRFDEFGMPAMQTADGLTKELAEAMDASDRQSMFYVFLDEIQEIPGWEHVVRGLHTKDGVDVTITGSNAHFLSSDLATLLAGRYVPIDVFPLSFREYMDFRAASSGQSGSVDEAFATYLRFGGMPGLFSLKEQDEDDVARELSAVFDTVILNDVAKRLGIRDLPLLERLVTYLFSTSGNLFSIRKVTGALKSAGYRVSQDTIENYIDALERAYILNGLCQSGLKGKELLNPLRKFYPVDTGLRNLTTNFAVEDLGFQLENVVANELMRRGNQVSVGAVPMEPSGTSEIDFVATNHQRRAYYQVTQSLIDEQVFEREIAPLRAVGDSFPKFILTYDHARSGITSDGIHIVSVMDWLRDKD